VVGGHLHRDAATDPNLRSAPMMLCDASSRFLQNAATGTATDAEERRKFLILRSLKSVLSNFGPSFVLLSQRLFGCSRQRENENTVLLQ
jgi:hypothetical protein